MSNLPAQMFAAHFPADCPPSDSLDSVGTFYRLVTQDPPCDDDLRSHAELGLALRADPCDRCGLSIYAERADAVAKYLEIVDRFGTDGTRIGRLVAQLLLTPEHGRLLPTPNRRKPDSHHTWWPCQGAIRMETFQQVVEDASHHVGN